ncbi:MAG: YihY/virulence factor BrkB family protein [Verrucomicrobiota bacterium]
MRTWLRNAEQSNWWQVIKRVWALWVEVDGDQRAAAFAYYLLLSLLPLVFILVSAGSLFVEREVATREVVLWIERYVPLTGEQEDGVMANIHGVLEKRGKINLAAFPLLLWGSLKFLRTLVRTTNRIWHSPIYNWWRLPLKSLGLLGITLSAAFLGILLPGIARLGRRWLATYLEFPQWSLSLMLNLLPWLILFCAAIMIYRLAPSRRTKFSEVWIGALAATVLIWIGEWLFLVYAVHFAHFNVLYGALGSVAAFLLWIYLSSCVGVFGVCYCAAQADVRAKGNSNWDRSLASKRGGDS